MGHLLVWVCRGWVTRGSELDLDLDACGDFNAHQSFDGLLAGAHNVDKALVGAALELLAFRS